MPEMIKLPMITDPRGSLTVLEKIQPFPIKRVFFISNVTGKRGGHGHKKTHMALICVSGEVTVSGQSPDRDWSFHLNSPTQCLWLKPEDWHEMHGFSRHATLVVLASEDYDKQDYFHEKYR
jgi:hypothetical protein